MSYGGSAPYLLHHLLETSSAAEPAKEAVVDGERRFSYADLRSAAGTCASVLRSLGLARRDRVALYLERGYEEAACILGVSMAGGVVVPVNPLLKPAQVQHILADCSVRLLITSAERWQRLGGSASRCRGFEALVVAAPPSPGSGVHSFQLDNEICFEEADVCIGEDLAAILYTSGSTGRPKGVMLSHRNILAGSRIVAGFLHLEQSDRILSVLPFSFDYGLNQLITAVDRRATIVILTFRFGDEIVRALSTERITGLAGVPTVWSILTRAAPALREAELSHLRYLTNSGGAVPSATVRRLRELLPHANVFLMYGLTEAFRSTYLDPDEVDRRPTSVGKAIPETEVFLVDPTTLRRCGPDEPGHLVHRGPTVAMGYWNRPEDTARSFRPHPSIPATEGGGVVCYSGDVMRLDRDGNLYFVARDDSMIKSSGYRISPTEVEEVLIQSGRLREAAVIGLPDPTAGERVHAVVVAVDATGSDRELLFRHCADNLPPYMVPREIEFVSDLPRSPNGKIDYASLHAARDER